MTAKSSILRFVLCVPLALAAHVQAATVTKAAFGTDLTDGASWGGTAPSASDTATWLGSSLGAGLTLGSDAAWLGLNVTGASSNIDVSGAGVLTLGGGGLDLSQSAVNLAIGNNIVLDAVQTWKVAPGKTLLVTGAVSGTTGLTIGATAPTMSSSIFLTGTAQTLFSNTALSSVTAASGQMGGAWVNTGVPVAGNGYLLSNNGSLATYWLEALDGGYTKGVKVELTQSGANIAARALSSKYIAGSLPGYNFETGGLTGTLATSQAGSGYGAYSTTITIGADSTGTITLSGPNTYSGATTVNRGTLKAGVASVAGVSGAFGLNSAVILANASGTGLDLNGFDTSIGSLTGGGAAGGTVALGAATLTVGTDNTSPGAYAGVISGTGGLVKTGTGTLALTTAANTYSGGTTVNGGTLTGAVGTAYNSTQAGSFGAGPVTVNAGATIATAGVFVLGGGQNSTRVVNIAGTANIQSASTGGEYIRTLNLTGGTITFTSGAVYFRAPNGGITLNTLAAATSSTISTGIDLTLGNLAVDVAQGSVPSGQDLVISGNISENSGAGSGAKTLTKSGAGTLALTGSNNTYSGVTTVNGGTLIVNGTLAASIAGTVTVNTGATLSGTGTINRPITIAAGAHLTPAGAAIGTLTSGNAVALLGTTTCQIDKTGGVFTKDLLQANAITYGGTLEVVATGESLAEGDSIKLFNATTYGGGFTATSLPSLPAGLSWELSDLVTTGTIKVVNTTPNPTFNPPAGSYVGALSVIISSEDGSTIHYTTDGSDPLTSPTVITAVSPTAGIVIPTDTPSFVLTAYASEPGKGDSSTVSATYHTISVPTWAYPMSGNWSDPANWINGVQASGSGVLADFSTLALTADTTVTLDGSRTIGHMVFGDLADASKWSVAGSSVLALATGGGAPTITVNNQTTTISVTMAGAQGLAKLGDGTLKLTGINAYSGDTVVTTGSLLIDSSTAPNQAVVLASEKIVNQSTVTFYRNAVGHTSVISSLSGPGDYYVDGPGGGSLYDYRFAFRGLASDNTGTVHLVNSGRLWIDRTPTNAIGDSALVDVGSTAALYVYQGISETIGGLTGTGNVYGGDAAGSSTLIVGGGDRSAVFGGVLQNNSSTLSLTKTGTGTQVLAGVNTYTGTTTVNGGTLEVNGSLAAGSAVTVQAAGTLAGTGTVAGSVTAAGTLAPGGNSVGQLTLGNTVLTGTYACQIEGATSDVLTTGTLNLTGATLVVSEISPASNFPYPIATYTPGGLTGAFTPPVGYVLDYSTPGVIKLNISAGYAAWSDANAPGQTMAMDHDHDGVPNGIEYFMGLSGSDFTANPAPDATGKIIWPKGALYTGVYGTDFVVQTSSDLAIWDDVPSGSVGVGVNVEYTLPPGEPGKFARLKVMGP